MRRPSSWTGASLRQALSTVAYLMGVLVTVFFVFPD